MAALPAAPRPPVHFSSLAVFAVVGVTAIEATSTSDSEVLINSRKSVAGVLRWYLHFFNSITKSVARKSYGRYTDAGLLLWDMVGLLAACSLVQAYRLWRQRSRKDVGESGMARRSLEKVRTSIENITAASNFGTSLVLFPASLYVGSR